MGGLLAFFTVVAIVVWLPIHTFDPPPSADWAPLSNQAVAGRKIFAQNGCYVCHSGYSRPQDVRHALYFLYPKISEPGDFWGSDQSPNLLGTERTGPDLSQEAGWHPDDWQRAHFYDPRFVDPLSLMPSMKSLFSDTQVENLISFVQMRSGKSGLLRYAGQLYAKHVVLTNQGFKPAPTGFQGAHKDPRGQPTGRSAGPARGGAEPRADRPRLLVVRQPAAGHRAEPPARQAGVPRALRRLSRPRRRRQGPGREVHGAAAGGLHRQGRRLLRRRHRARATSTTASSAAGRGPAMENFGDRLSVDDIWRVVLFIKTIPNHTLDTNVVPEPKDYIVWQPSKELLDWLETTQKPTGNASFDKKAVTDPFMKEAMRVFPGLAPGDSFFINEDAGDAVARGGAQRDPDDLPRPVEPRMGRSEGARREAAAASRRSSSRRPCRGSNEAAPTHARRRRRRRARAARAGARARRTRERPVEVGDGGLDDGHVLHLLGPRVHRLPRSLEGGPLPRAREHGAIPLLVHEEDYYTPEWALDEEEWADGRCRAVTHRRRRRSSTTTSSPTTRPSTESDTWHVDWFSLAWMWGFVAALSVILIWWIWQYRSTRQKAGIYSVDDWSGFTSELARPATRFFVLFTAIVTGFAVALIVGHIVHGQIF